MVRSGPPSLHSWQRAQAIETNASGIAFAWWMTVLWGEYPCRTPCKQTPFITRKIRQLQVRLPRDTSR